MSSEIDIIDIEIVEDNNDVDMQIEENQENNDEQFENVEDDDEEQINEIEVLELQDETETPDNVQVQEVHESTAHEPKFVQEVKVLLVDSPVTQKMVTVEADSENTLPEIIGVVGNYVKHNEYSNTKHAHLLDVMNSKCDYILELSNSQNSTENSSEILNNSQASTKVNYLDLSDKENENDIPIEEDTNLVRVASIESILSSRSLSPELGEDDNQESTGTIQLDSSSLINSKSSKKSKSSKFRDILTIYPPPPEKGGISININDYQCLESNEFLNDVIIDFYLTYLMREVLSPQDRQRTHIFSSHFYTRFAKPYDNIDDSAYVSENERLHAGVRRWTKNVDIFEKDFIVIPVNEHAHWYLVIICFPHLVGNDDDIPFTSYKNPLTEEVQRPCILIFDSLNINKSTVITKLRGYLSSEYFAKKGVHKSFSVHHLNLVRPRIPKQSNATDCGLFVLQYVENFFKVPIKDYSSPFKSLTDWFTHKVIDEKRENIANLIQKLSIDFHEGKDVHFPNLNFQKKKRTNSDLMTDSEDAETKDIQPKRKTRNISHILDSDSEEEQVIVPIRIKISNNLPKEKNKSSWRDIHITDKESSPICHRVVVKKTVPCYANSSESPIQDKPPVSLKNKSYQLGSPPYYLPSQTTGIQAFKKLQTNHNITMDLEESSGSPIRVLTEPYQSRSQKILKASLQNNKLNKFFQGNPTPTVAMPNVSDKFYSIKITKDNKITSSLPSLPNFKIKKRIDRS